MSIKFKDFNAMENSKDEQVYVVLRNSEPIMSRVTLKSYSEILHLATLDPLLEIGWMLPKNYTVIEFSNETITDTILKLHEPVLLMHDKNKNVYRLVVEYMGKNTEHNMLGCGTPCNTWVSNTKKHYFLPLSFKSSTNTSPIVANISLLHYNSIASPAKWLSPLFKSSKTTDDHSIRVPLYDPKTDMRKMLMVYKHTELTTKDQANLIRFINDHFAVPRLGDEDLEGVLEAGYLKSAEFFDPINGKFFHDLMGEYLIKEHHIKLEEGSNNLYLWDDQENIYKHDDNNLLYIMTKIAPSLRVSQKDEVIEYIKQILYPKRVKFNRDPFTVVFKNGIFNLRTKHFKPMDESHLETIKIKANYDPSVKSKIVDEFFNNVTVGNKEIQQLLLEAIGYAMLKTNGLQKAFILLGGGRNGKSTFLTLMRALLGEENVGSLSFKDLSNTFRSSGLTNKLASLAGDISAQSIQDSDLVKSMIGGDLVKVERKFKDAYDIEMFATMFFAANKLPRTPDTTTGFYRRFAIIPFKANLSRVSKVQGELFVERLTSQDSIDYVATLATEAIFNVYHVAEDFIEPAEVKDLLDKYKIENSSLLSWVYEAYKNEPKLLITKNIRTLYDEYSVWCEQNHTGAVRSARFRTELESEYLLTIDIDGKLEFDIADIEYVTASGETSPVDRERTEVL